MFNEEFVKMSAADQHMFAETCNNLLLKGFIVRDVYDNREKIMRINPYYRFIDRYFEVFESYLKFSGWHIEKDGIMGVVALSNEYEDNRLRIDRETSLILFALRLIYENSKSESNETTLSIFMTTPKLLTEMLNHNITMPGKRLSGRGIAKSLRFLANHNIISKVSGSYDEGNVSFFILPSIVYALSGEKITAMSNALDQIHGKETSRNENLD